MNREAAGAIGDIAGAAAVVPTLLCLASETRKGAPAFDATTTREFGFRVGGWAGEVATEPEFKRNPLEGLRPEPEDFSEAEWHEFRLFAHSLFFIYQTSFSHMKLDLGNREESKSYVRLAKGLIDGFSAWRRFWEEEALLGAFTGCRKCPRTQATSEPLRRPCRRRVAAGRVRIATSEAFCAAVPGWRTPPNASPSDGHR